LEDSEEDTGKDVGPEEWLILVKPKWPVSDRLTLVHLSALSTYETFCEHVHLPTLLR